MNIFKVFDTKKNVTAKDGFTLKQDAKKHRNELNGEGFRFIVARSSDHNRGPSNLMNKEKQRSW